MNGWLDGRVQVVPATGVTITGRACAGVTTKAVPHVLDLVI
jgi:hypothetical protein